MVAAHLIGYDIYRDTDFSAVNTHAAAGRLLYIK